MKSKAEVTDCFVHFKKHFEQPDKGETIRRLRDDNGGEYIAGKLQRLLFQEGIDWEPTEVYTPEMNGAAERLGQTLWRKAAPLLKYAGVDLEFWPEAVRHATYLYLRSPHSAIGTTPFAAFYR
jgi:transposase InsO family protein